MLGGCESAETGADPHARDKNGETPLHDAADKGHVAAVAALADAGANLNARTVKGATPLLTDTEKTRF